MPRPTPAHRRLEKFAGTWTGEETMYPSPWDPHGGKAEARLCCRIDLDGFAAIGDYEQQRGGTVTFRGHGVFTWDANAQQYVLHWFDSMGMGCEVFRGTFAGDALTLQSRNAQGHARVTYDFSQPRRLATRMETSTDGRTWSTFFDGVYTRSS